MPTNMDDNIVSTNTNINSNLFSFILLNKFLIKVLNLFIII